MSVLSVAVALAVFAPIPRAVAAPQQQNAQDVVYRLQADGYRVILTRVGTNSLATCAIVRIRPGRTITEPSALGDDLENVTVYTTVYVDAQC